LGRRDGGRDLRWRVDPGRWPLADRPPGDRAPAAAAAPAPAAPVAAASTLRVRLPKRRPGLTGCSPNELFVLLCRDPAAHAAGRWGTLWRVPRWVPALGVVGLLSNKGDAVRGEPRVSKEGQKMLTWFV